MENWIRNAIFIVTIVFAVVYFTFGFAGFIGFFSFIGSVFPFLVFLGIVMIVKKTAQKQGINFKSNDLSEFKKYFENQININQKNKK